MLRSVDTPVKRDVLKEVTLEWRTADEIEQTFGQEGREAIIFFEKMKLVETRWLSKNGGYPEKSYHTYYTSFSINAQWPVYEISDVLTAAMMGDEEYAEVESKILAEVGKDGRFSGDVAEALGLTSTMLKSLVRRSVKMDYRGHRIELIHEE
jgi:predicted DNA-binding ArsR family transcriptional regulator